jgi:mono/diheme cytochrome c family protein
MGVVLVAAMLLLRGSGITSRRKPYPLEEWAARSARTFLIPRAIRNAVNPVPPSPDVIRGGMEHFADHCALCHANDGSGEIHLGKAMFPRAPDMRTTPTQAMTDGELFYVIEHGIPLTGMAAWANGTPDGERSTWELVRFIRHLPQITPEEVARMEALNPKTAGDEMHKHDIDDFLSGKGKTIR